MACVTLLAFMYSLVDCGWSAMQENTLVTLMHAEFVRAKLFFSWGVGDVDPIHLKTNFYLVKVEV